MSQKRDTDLGSGLVMAKMHQCTIKMHYQDALSKMHYSARNQNGTERVIFPVHIGNLLSLNSLAQQTTNHAYALARFDALQ